MKILLTSDWYTPAVNGVVTSVLNLRRQLTAQGHQVRVLTLAEGLHTYTQDGVYYIGSVDAGCVYPGARLRGPAVRQTVQQLVDWKPDVVHSQCEFSTFPLARRIATAVHAPLVHTYHTVYEDYTHYFSPSRRWGRALAAGFSRAVLARTDAVFAPTDKVRQLLLSYGVRQPVYVVPTGIELAPFAAPADPARTAQLRSQLGIPQGNRVLVYLGRLAREKNLDELLDCRAQLHAPVTLLLVGGGPEQERLAARAAQLNEQLGQGAVVLAGMVPPQQVADYYHLGDVFLSASQSETQGLTYIEALAAGLPAVCRADPCLNGVIADGENGWQYRAAPELTRRVEQLLADDALRCRMAACAARQAQQFSAQQFAQNAARLYRAQVWRMGGAVAPQQGERIWQSV